MQTPLNLITVKESARRELHASGVHLHVRIAGQSFFTGAEAFKKAAEVASCVQALVEAGIAADQVHLKDVRTEVESGVMSKSSSATYRIEVRCPSVELLGPALAAISAQKNAGVESLSWQYGDLEAARRDVLQDAVSAAHASARAIADALSTSLGGVHKLSYDVGGLEPDLEDLAGDAMAATRRRSMQKTEALRGLSMSHTTELQAAVTAQFIVG